MQDNGVAAHLNGKRLLSYVDAPAGYYTNGALGLEHWTDTYRYAMEFDDVMVSLLLNPVATNDTYSLAAGSSLTVAPPGVLSNDYTAVFDLNAVLVSGPAHGTLTLQTNGGFTYTPSTGYSGVDTFTYRATDGRSTSAVATVTLNVTANARPVAANDSYAALSGASLIVPAPGVLANDSDPEGQPLAAILASAPTRGKLTLNTNGGFVYVSTPGYSGSDTFTYRASDGVTNSSTATVTLNLTAPASLFSDTFTRGADPARWSPGRCRGGLDGDGRQLWRRMNRTATGMYFGRRIGRIIPCRAPVVPDRGLWRGDCRQARRGDGRALCGLGLPRGVQRRVPSLKAAEIQQLGEFQRLADGQPAGRGHQLAHIETGVSRRADWGSF